MRTQKRIFCILKPSKQQYKFIQRNKMTIERKKKITKKSLEVEIFIWNIDICIICTSFYSFFINIMTIDIIYWIHILNVIYWNLI